MSAEAPETAELQALVTVVDSGSLIKAAATLGLPRATLGRRLARLEEKVGVRLVRRTTRSLVLTDAGEAFVRHARMVLAALDDAVASLGKDDDTPRGDLRVSVPTGLPPSFSRVVCEFAEAYPDVRVVLHYSTAYVDLRRDGYDIVLRVASELEPGLVARTLMRDQRVLVASPEYLARHGTPRTRADLKRHKCLVGFSGGDLVHSHWPSARGQVHVTPVLASNSADLLRQAVLKGLGLAQLSLLAIGGDLRAGKLVHVMPAVMDVEVKGVIVYADRELVPPQVKLFAERVVAWAEHEIEPPKKARG